MLKKALLFSLFSINTLTSQVDYQWLKLLRYEGTFFGNYQSQVINKEFFINEHGNKDPQAELESSIDYISKNPTDFYCRFPARSQYLYKRKLITKPNFSTCEKFLYFKRKVNPSSVAIVFASYYINNPSSMFGHTFIKLNKKGKGNNNDLLHWGANFSANVTSSNPLIYGLYGVTGGFSANYSLLPYYFKVREYAESESRELWEYHLNIPDEHLEFFVSHLWEMEKALFNYYYFNGNCSSQIINFLDAIFPEKELSKRLTTFVIPSQTIRILTEDENLIKEIRFRPSNFQKVSKRWESLNQDQKKEFKDFKNDPLKYELTNKDPNLLDVYIDYLDFKHPIEVAKEDTLFAKKKHQVLIARSEATGEVKKINFQESEDKAPHHAHKERSVPLGYKHFKKQKALSFGYRFSMHNIMDPTKGYSPLGGQEMGDFKFFYLTKTKKLRFQSFHLLNIDTYPQLFGFNPKIGWSMTVGAKDYFDTEHFEKAPFAKHGLHLNLSQNQSMIFAPEFHYSIGYSDSFIGNDIRVDLMPGLSFFSDSHRAKFKLHYHYNFVTGPRSENHHVYRAQLTIPLFQNLSWKSSMEKWVSKGQDKENFQSDLNYYF